MKKIIRLEKCKICRKYPFYDKDYKEHIHKIFCEHYITSSKNIVAAINDWNSLNQVTGA